MGDLRGQVLAILRSIWRRRWYIVAISWTLCLVGWGVVMILPDRYESKTRIYVDTQTMLAPLLRGIAVASNLDQQVAFMQRTLLSRPNMSQVVRMADLDLSVTNERDMEALLDGLSQ